MRSDATGPTFDHQQVRHGDASDEVRLESGTRDVPESTPHDESKSGASLPTEAEPHSKSPRYRTSIPNLDEATLVALLHNQERQGIELLYDRYAGSLFGVLFKLLRAQEPAEDALQETFLKIWSNFDQYDPSRGRLFTWMVNIARNVALDKIKSREHRNSQKNQEIGSVVDLLEGQSVVEETSDHIGLREIVHSLKAEQEEVIDLIYFQGYTQAEASEKLGIPLGTVKTRVRAAVTAIRKFFS